MAQIGLSRVYAKIFEITHRLPASALFRQLQMPQLQLPQEHNRRDNHLDHRLLCLIFGRH